jgi:hypothetical protein
MRSAGSIPASVKAPSYARFCESVSTVEPGLAGHDDDSAVELVLQRRPHVVGVGGVEDDELLALCRADDLGSQRRPTHAAEDDMVEALADQLVAQCRDLADQRP